MGLEAVGVPCEVEVLPPQLVLPESLLPGEVARQNVTLVNHSDAAANFEFEGACAGSHEARGMSEDQRSQLARYGAVVQILLLVGHCRTPASQKSGMS